MATKKKISLTDEQRTAVMDVLEDLRERVWEYHEEIEDQDDRTAREAIDHFDDLIDEIIDEVG